jgi:hypothetical protein
MIGVAAMLRRRLSCRWIDRHAANRVADHLAGERLCVRRMRVIVVVMGAHGATFRFLSQHGVDLPVAGWSSDFFYLTFQRLEA